MISSTASIPTIDEPGTAPPVACRLPAEIVAIGVSTGGPVALHHVLERIPADFPAPIVIVQHLPAQFTRTLAEDLNRTSAIEVVEGTDGRVLERGVAVLAPGGKQMRVVRSHHRLVVQITDEEPERNCRPSVDYLFRSLAECCGARTFGVVLTGMGDDGTAGCRALKQAGARIIAQNEATCVVYGMPRCVVEAGLADGVAPLNEIADRMIAATQRRAAP